ncbi:MAG: hypothetical protein QW531_04635 [Thermoplasmata archaeon]
MEGKEYGELVGVVIDMRTKTKKVTLRFFNTRRGKGISLCSWGNRKKALNWAGIEQETERYVNAIKKLLDAQANPNGGGC